MDLQTYLAETGATQSELAAQLGVSQSLVAQWVRRAALPPPLRCVEIELATGGLVARPDLRPGDWERIWPELYWLETWREWGAAQTDVRIGLREFVRCVARWLISPRA